MSFDRYLQKYIDLFTDGKTGLSIFVPLCGKSLDLKWYVSANVHFIGNKVDIFFYKLKSCYKHVKKKICFVRMCLVDVISALLQGCVQV